MTTPDPAAPSPPLAGYARAATLAAVAGLRSMLPAFAIVAATRRDGDRAAFAPRPQPDAALRSPLAFAAFALAAGGEIVGDKLPFTPDRIAPGPLGGRVASGALVGAAVARDARLAPAVGGAIGAIAAVGGSFGGYYARRALARATPLPAITWALAEDALAVALALVALRSRP